MSIIMGSSLLTFGDGTSQNWASAIKGASYSTVLPGTGGVNGTGFTITVPSGTCMITMNFADVSLTGTDDIAFKFINAAGTSPVYNTQTINIGNSGTCSGTSSSSLTYGYISSGAGASLWSGTMNFWLDTGPNSVGSSVRYSGLFKYSTAGCQIINGYCSYDTSAITSLTFYPSGTNTFDNGTVNFTEYTSLRG